jgi:hypothetical protein
VRVLGNLPCAKRRWPITAMYALVATLGAAPRASLVAVAVAVTVAATAVLPMGKLLCTTAVLRVRCVRGQYIPPWPIRELIRHWEQIWDRRMSLGHAQGLHPDAVRELLFDGERRCRLSLLR